MKYLLTRKGTDNIKPHACFYKQQAVAGVERELRGG
jgi:hypothetical protein